MKSNWVDTIIFIWFLTALFQWTYKDLDKAVLWPARAARELVEEYKR